MNMILINKKREKREREKREREKQEHEKREREKQEREKQEHEKQEREKREREQQEQEREQQEREQQEREQREREKREREQQEREQQEREQQEREQQEREKQEREQQEREQQEREQQEREKQEREQQEREQQEHEKREREKQEREQQEREKQERIKRNQDYLNKIKIKLVIFHSQGKPHDNALDITDQNNIMIETYKNDFDEIIVYTPEIIRNLGYGDLCNDYEDFGVIKANKEQKNIGFSKWKPLILKLELLKSTSNDIIVYHDVNCKKYPIYNKFTQVRNTIFDIINECNYDFFFPQEHGNKLKRWCKNTVLLELGKNKDFNREFSQFCVNFIILKNTTITMCMLDEWLECCKNERWINGVSYHNENSYFCWYCPEQSIINNIIANWIKEKKHNIDKKFPFFYLDHRNINNCHKITNYDYLKYLEL